MALLDEMRTAPLQRSLADHLLALGLGLTLLGVAWLYIAITHRSLEPWEREMFNAVNRLPDGLRPVLWPPMQLGNFWIWLVAVPVLYGVFHRPAPAIAVALASVTAWALAKVIKELAGRGRPAVFLDGVHLRESGIHGLGFVSGHVALAAAFAAALSPWLPRPARIVAWTLVGVVGFARIYFGAHLPLDVVGGLGIGLTCGALASLIVGTPVR
jgi:undecaprenyl-diphosphatase